MMSGLVAGEGGGGEEEEEESHSKVGTLWVRQTYWQKCLKFQKVACVADL